MSNLIRRLPRISEFPYLTLILAAASLGISCIGIEAALAFDGSFRSVWRVATCHFAHWNLEHLFWSGGTFVVLGTLSERADRRAFFGCVAASALAIPFAVSLFLPDLPSYAGLSGIDSALFVLVAFTMLRDAHSVRDWPWVAATGVGLAAFVGKIAFEAATGATVFVESGAEMIPVPLAHAVGGLVGALSAIPPAGEFGALKHDVIC